MKSSTKDHTIGEFHKLKGSAKVIAGKLSDNPKLKAEGIIEKISGEFQLKAGQIKKVFGK